MIESLPNFKNEKHQKLALNIAGIAVASSILYTYYRILTRTNKKKESSREIPVPGSSYPLVGHMFSLGEKPGETISKWHAELGPIIKLNMGAQTWVVVDDPALAQKVFVGHGAETSYRVESTYSFKHYSMGGKGIAFAQPGPGLKENRAAAFTVLAPRIIADKYMELIKRESYELVSRLIESTEIESGVDPLKYLELNSMNIMFLSLFGRRFNDVTDQEFISLTGINDKHMKYLALEHDLGNFFPKLSFINKFAGIHAEQKKYIETERDPLYKKLIKEALAYDEPNVMKSLGENGYHFTQDEMIVFASDLVAAGTDTISVTLHWTFAIMCNYPTVQQKVVAEIDQFIEKNGRIPEFTEREEVPYCISVIKECMRYKPTTPFGLPRAVREDVEVDGYIIPKGALVIANMDSLHKNPEFYPDPLSFYPDRYMNNLKTMQSAANGRFENRDQFNFGFGRRICPGIYLSEVELFYAFVQLFARTLVEPVDGVMPNIEKARHVGAILRPHKYKVQFFKRN